MIILIMRVKIQIEVGEIIGVTKQMMLVPLEALVALEVLDLIIIK
jgi:hypothetical protein